MVIAIKLAKRSFNDTIRNFPAVNFNYTFVSLYDHLLPRRNSLNFYHLQFFPPLPRTRTMHKFIYLNKEKEKQERRRERKEKLLRFIRTISKTISNTRIQNSIPGMENISKSVAYKSVPNKRE